MEQFLRKVIRAELDLVKDEILDEIRETREKSRYLTRKQVAQYLSIGLSTVDYWSRIGKIRKIEIEGSVRFDKEEIDAILKAKTQRHV